MPIQPVKTMFAFHSHLLDKWTNETMWAELIDFEKDLYRLISIPLYATSVAWGDIIRAPFSQEQQFPLFEELVEPSGHSTVQVVMLDGQDLHPLMKQFRNIGCDCEVLNDNYFVVDVPSTIDYAPVQTLLKECQSAGLIDYAEACLSSVHYYD